ncbi:MAG: S24/S26 family peptidase [Kangiellaceae bacterium]|nr:S24/S26 family peptidase [Kangiellaceae bacterium]
MSPTLASRDFVLSLRFPWSNFNPGEIVLVQHPEYHLIVKRVSFVDEHQIQLQGDNTASVSSELMGWIDLDNIVGKIIWHFPAPSS